MDLSKERTTTIKKILSNENGMQNFERARNRILYSQNRYESYDLDM